MTQKEKDDLCDGRNFQSTLEQIQFIDKRNQSPSLKRYRTNGSELQYEQNYEYENNNDGYIEQTHKSRYKKRNNYSRLDQTSSTSSRIYTNSNTNSNKNENKAGQQQHHTASNINASKENCYEYDQNIFPISNQALSYAATTHLQHIKLECEPKLKEQKLAVKFIQQFFKFIEKAFRQQNITYQKAIGFEQWWIDKNGDIQGVTNEIDLYVFLCNIERYPKEVENIKITPHPPKRLPTQRSIIIKWIKNTITNDEIKEELEIKYKSIYALEDIIGTLNLRNRHNCRRCDQDRNDNNDHKSCEIKCHHCGGAHTSTDYFCPVIQKFRYELINELKTRPDLLPTATQLFIPTDCREHGSKIKVLENKLTQNQISNKNQHQLIVHHSNFADQSQWPSLPSASLYSSTTSLNDNLIETTKSLSNELKIIKENYAAEQKRLEERYNNHLNLMNQSWLIMQQQMQTQTEMLNTMDGIINSILFTSCANVMEVLTQTVLKLLNENNHTELNPILALLQQQTLYMNDKKSIYTSHQIKLNMLVEKQREALKSALNTIIKQPNVQ
ncbi:unnamed protein product [Rotaria sp. Silwood2]|nr:unnamed protein product [Rotaria sp. Silwood2]